MDKFEVIILVTKNVNSCVLKNENVGRGHLLIRRVLHFLHVYSVVMIAENLSNIELRHSPLKSVVTTCVLNNFLK